jgi:hypothetical protein
LKNFLATAALIAVLGAIGLVAAFAFLIIGIHVVAIAIGNLAIWPLMFMTVFGLNWSFGTVIAIATAMAVALCAACYLWPAPQKEIADKVGAAFSVVTMSIIVLVILGLPGFILIGIFFVPKLSPWALPLVGLATALVLSPFVWKKRPE